MKRSLCCLFIVVAILAQTPAWGQSGPPPDDQTRVKIVIFKAPCLAEQVTDWAPSAGPGRAHELLESPRAAAYRRTLEREQDEVIGEVDRELRSLRQRAGTRSLEVLYRQTELINMMLLRVDAAAEAALRRHPNVSGVFDNAIRYPVMDSAPALVNAPAFWEMVGGVEQAGAGIRIAIVDSGINVDHPMLRDNALTAPAGFPQPARFAEFTNSKVIVARNYVLTEFSLNAEPDTPRDIAGHGSRVAAAAGGNTTMGPVGVVQGIAPKSFLGNYRVFGDPTINPTTTSSAIIAAVRDALADGMDIINLSLGGPATDPLSDPEQIVIANAVRLGIVVVVAAGNNGSRGSGSITSPGTSPDVITVGATTHNRRLLNAMKVDSDSTTVPPELETIEILPGNGAPLSEALGPLPLASVMGQDPSQEACSPLQAGSLTGRIALISRGSCLFSIKAANVLGGADASAMVLYNNVEGPPVRADFGDNPPSRPAGMITKREGEQLLQLLQAGQSVNVTLEPLLPVATVPDILAGFSGRGPNIDGTIKPDLVAPGVEILSAGPTGSSYIIASNGTSFATPQVAGAAALVMQAHPDWTPQQIKSALVNTATVATIDGQNAASVNQVGAGRLDLAAASQTQVAISPVSLSFGELSLTQGMLPPLPLSLTNLGPDLLELEIAAVSDQPALRFMTPEMVALPPGETVEVEVRPALSGSPAPGQFEGSLRILIPGKPSLRVPFWGILTSGGNVEVLQVSQFPGAQFASIEEALSRAEPGDVIEIQDSEVYSGPLKLLSNRQGQFLHGVTLRAAPGHAPTIAAPADATAVIEIASLENVTIQGLQLSGGQLGIVASNSTGVIRDCIFQGDQQKAVELNHSLFHLYGNDLMPGPGRGVELFNSTALVQKNHLGSDSDGRSEVGLFSSPDSSVAIFDNQVWNTHGSQNGQGFRITGPALIKNNLVAAGKGPLADGILVRGEQAVVKLVDNLVIDNQRNGISVFDGARANLLRQHSLNNQGAGLLVQDSSATVSSSSFLENSTGILANFPLDLSLESSLAAGSSGDGLTAAGDSSSRIVVSNSTLADNSQFGISWNQGFLEVTNSIFWNNSSGDLSAPAASVEFSLVDDPSLIGLMGNYASNPQFFAPDQFDYAPAATSPVIDAGPELAANPAGDLHSRVRVVDGDGDGEARIDTGAVEFAAEPPPLLMPVLERSEGEFQGLALANVFAPPQVSRTAQGNSVSNSVRLRFYDPNGTLLEEVSPEVKPGQQVSQLLEDLFPSQTGAGWIEITPSAPDLLSFTLVGADDLDYLDGTQLGPALHKKLVLPEVLEHGDTLSWLYLLNPHPAPQNIEIRWLREGSPAGTQTRRIGPHAMLATALGDLFPGAQGGFLEIEGDRPLAALQVFGHGHARGGLAGVAPSNPLSHLVGAQLASTLQIDTFVSLINTEAQEVTVVLMARDDAGGIVDQITLVLQPHQELEGSIQDLFTLPSGEFTGWLSVRSVSGGLAGSLRFSDPADQFLAALPLQPEGAREFLLSHVAQTDRIFTGLTLVNSGVQAAAASIEVFSEAGDLQGVAFVALGPGQKLARLVSQLVPEVTQQSGGYIRVRSTQPLAGFELFGDQELNYLSAVPQQVVVR